LCCVDPRWFNKGRPEFVRGCESVYTQHRVSHLTASALAFISRHQTKAHLHHQVEVVVEEEVEAAAAVEEEWI